MSLYLCMWIQKYCNVNAFHFHNWQKFYCNFHYYITDDVLFINNLEFESYLGQIYSGELEIKNTTESFTSASDIDLLLSIGKDGQFNTSIYDKRVGFNFRITNFPFLCSNIPSSPSYGVFFLSAYTIRPGLLLIWLFYSEGQATFQSATQTGIPRWTLEIVIKEVIWSIRGSY